MFSIRDVQRRPVAFGGRVLPGSQGRTPSTSTRRRRRCSPRAACCTAWTRPGRPISQSRTVLVMEGYTDVIVAHQYGFTNAVAVLGTALGERHIPLLRRFADRIVLMLDGDEAGQRRTNEVLNLFVQEQIDLQILTLPDRLDPCDYLQQRGADAFREQLSLARSMPWSTSSASRPTDLDASSGIHRVTAGHRRDSGHAGPGAAAAHGHGQRRQGERRSDPAPARAALRRGGRNAAGAAGRAAPQRKPRATRKPEAAPLAKLPPLERTLLELLLLAPEQAATRLPGNYATNSCNRPRTQIIFSKCRQLCAGRRAADVRAADAGVRRSPDQVSAGGVGRTWDELNRASIRRPSWRACLETFRQQRSNARLATARRSRSWSSRSK